MTRRTNLCVRRWRRFSVVFRQLRINHQGAIHLIAEIFHVMCLQTNNFKVFPFTQKESKKRRRKDDEKHKISRVLKLDKIIFHEDSDIASRLRIAFEGFKALGWMKRFSLLTNSSFAIASMFRLTSRRTNQSISHAAKTPLGDRKCDEKIFLRLKKENSDKRKIPLVFPFVCN